MFNTTNPPPNVEEQEVYNYYMEILFPAFLSSLPVLLSRLAHDACSHLCNFTTVFIQFLFPLWFRPQTTGTISGGANDETGESMGKLLSHIWSSDADGNNSTFIDYMLWKMDRENDDGNLSAIEWSSNTEVMKKEVELMIHQHYRAVTDRADKVDQSSEHSWLVNTFIPVDWSWGAYLWQTCSGLIIVLAITSILPGRLHGWTGRVLRFPVLGMTYMMIFSELAVYVFVRLSIRVMEGMFANRKHRALRKRLDQAKSYEQWYEIAKRLDDSQGREEWRNNVDDDTAYRYSWPFIRELLSRLRSSRKNKGIKKVIATLQKCTRKNVGGLMSDDLFSFTNTGEPKRLVSEFQDEVESTLLWVTEEVQRIYRLPEHIATDTFDECSFYQEEKELQEDKEQSMIQHLLSWNGLDLQESQSTKEGDQLTKEGQDNDQNGKEVPKNFSIPTLLSIDSLKTGSTHQKEELESARLLISKLDEEKPQPNEEEHPHIIQHVMSFATFGILGNKSADNKRETDHNSKDSNEENIVPIPTGGAEQYNMKDTTGNVCAESLLMREKVKTFLKRARAAYGRTALCLSGGAMMGNYHFGVVKALLENDLLPSITSGSSAGAIVGAMICTRTKEELLRDLTPEVLAPKMTVFASSWGQRLARWYRHGTMFDQEDWYRRAKFFTCGDLTFEEAYQKTGRIFCITLSATSKKAPPVLINYITAPNVVIASAVVASAAVPGFVDAMKLKVKDENGVVRDQARRDETYRDGSIESDIPTTGLAEMLNCRFFLAAQANPHIVPFFFNSKGDVGRPSRWSGGQRDASWRGGYLLSALEMYLKADMRSKFHFLNDLEVAVGFTSTLMTQNYKGSTTIVPQVCFRDYLLVRVDDCYVFDLSTEYIIREEQPVDDMKRYFQGGSVAAYQHIAMLKLHYKIAHTLDECLARLEYDESPNHPPRRRLSQSFLRKSSSSFSVQTTGNDYLFRRLDQSMHSVMSDDGFILDDEHEKGGFDGVECSFGPKN